MKRTVQQIRTRKMNTIHIGWDGPLALEAVKALNKPTDYGIYQIYGPHPTYCKVELLYIGLASKQTFAVRIPKSAWWAEFTRDPSQTSIYVGRLLGSATPENTIWEKQIELTERLLIYAHYPTYNKQKDSRTYEQDFKDLHILNWQRHRDLLPEISGARCGRMPILEPYGSHKTDPNQTR
jgi:hypothetical protein